MKLHSKTELLFFQALYFAGLNIAYIDESIHSKHRFIIEAHFNNKIEFSIFTSRREMYRQALNFFTDYSDAEFFVLRDNKIKFCFKSRY